MEGREVTLDEMLQARDFRAGRQAAHPGQTLVCLTLNIAGPVKRFPLADRAFEAGKHLVDGALIEEKVDDCGHWALFTTDMDPGACKALMMDIERDHPIGRLLDLDVIGPDGRNLARPVPRKCLICDRPAHVCARSRAHPLKAVQIGTYSILKGHFVPPFARAVEQAATRALRNELAATPKPGLVDRANSGAHRDMDYTRFLDAIAAFAPFFYLFTLNGTQGLDDQMLFSRLKDLGIQVEEVMLKATGGVNTHRGAIFALGLLAAGCGRLYARNERVTAEAMCAEAAKLGAVSCAERPDVPRSHGEHAYAEHGAGGARGEAAAGYPSVRHVALPELRKWLGRGASENDASVCALLRLIGEVEDTNLIARAGAEAAKAARADIRKRLNASGDELSARIDLAQALDKEFIAKNLSPGGCADLLAAAWMMHYIEGTG